jgi:hypothetical protein
MKIEVQNWKEKLSLSDSVVLQFMQAKIACFQCFLMSDAFYIPFEVDLPANSINVFRGFPWSHSRC